MAELSNIRNTGVIVGGDVTRSTISVGETGSAAGPDEAQLLRQLDAVIGELLAGVGLLPAEQAGLAARDVVALRAEVSATERDSGRIRAGLSRLTAAVSAAAPLAELAADIAEIVSRLVH